MERCIDGETQNVNESLNNVLWTRCPKCVYVGRSTIEIAVASAVLYFNDGGQGILEVFKNLGLNIGYFTCQGLWKKNEKRVKKIEIKSSEKGQKKTKKTEK